MKVLTLPKEKLENLLKLKISNDIIKIKLSRKRKSPVRLVIRLTGIRKGFAGKRFPDRTREQFLANEKFIRSAYPGNKK